MKNSDDNYGSEHTKHPDEASERDKKFLASSQHVLALTRLGAAGSPKMTPAVVAAASRLLNSKFDHPTLLAETKTFFRGHAIIVPQGLETIPPCWLKVLPTILWKTRKAHWHVLPYWMTHCSFENGIVAMRFEKQELVDNAELGAWDWLRVIVNLSVSPNLWNPLTKRQERAIWIKHRELRPELLNVPDSF